MNSRMRVAVVGFGTLGKYALEAVRVESDMELAGIVDPLLAGVPTGIPDVIVVDSIEKVKSVDLALLCIPTMQIPEVAPAFLEQSIATVDAFDLHGKEIVTLKRKLDGFAKAGGVVSISAAGWDPGLNSLLRAVIKLGISQGVTCTNFGPGMSLGHSVAARSVNGVADAVAVTIPLGTGKHRRMVYVLLEPGADLKQVEQEITHNAYFAKDETQIVPVDDLACMKDHGHGAFIERKGITGQTHNQRISCTSTINNPAVTSQVMVFAARAARSCQPGAYTLLDIPLIYFFAENIEQAETEII